MHMENALTRQGSHEAPAVPGAAEAALRLMLEQVRGLAAQSKLIAMNAAFEATAARGEAADIVGESGRAIDETERVAGIIDKLLLQINQGKRFSEPDKP
ncbi:MAG: hypothetical protein DPW12_13440 [Rhodocyclaceae bacterium]|jgi:hypothetical protein|nr:hypothetical protein [Rhodocyclaceae bacterium]OQY76170.1 MAG: hypothetical protein B6D47_00280 [Rhodocyclaceae bacterium UTPRO2]